MQTPLNSTGPAPSINSGTTSLANASAVSLIVYGQCWSMKNGKIRGLYKHPKVRQFEKDFAFQVRPEHKKNLGSKTHLLRSTITVYYPTWKQDCDVSVVYDLLQATGVVSNDRWIREKHEFAEVDPANPRVEIVIEEM